MKERLDNTIASEAGNPQLGETLRYQKEMASFKVWSNKAKAQERAFIAFLRNMKQLSWSNKTVAQKEQQQSRSKQRKQYLRYSDFLRTADAAKFLRMIPSFMDSRVLSWCRVTRRFSQNRISFPFLSLYSKHSKVLWMKHITTRHHNSWDEKGFNRHQMSPDSISAGTRQYQRNGGIECLKIGGMLSISRHSTHVLKYSLASYIVTLDAHVDS